MGVMKETDVTPIFIKNNKVREGRNDGSKLWFVVQGRETVCMLVCVEYTVWEEGGWW